MTDATPDREPESALFVMCAYGLAPSTRQGNRGPAAGLAARYLFPRLRAYIATYRDFYANPRSLEYMLARAAEARSEMGLSVVTLLIDDAWDDDGKAYAFSNNVESLANSRELVNLARGAAFDRQRWATGGPLVLFYPDALGLGRQGFERRLRAARGGAPVQVVNGRRRRFTLDGPTRFALAWRRLLATTRVCELLFAIAVVPVAAGLAAVDALRRAPKS